MDVIDKTTLTTNPLPTEKLSGLVERIVFHNPDTGFCVLRIKTAQREDLITVTALTPSLACGENIECSGQWISSKTYGIQFQAEQFIILAPNTLKGMEKYLGSGLVKGIGPHLAKQLINVFKEEVFNIIEQTPECLLKLPGIGEKRKNQLITAWQEHRSVRNIMVFLQSYGLGTARAVRIYKTYGEQSIAKVRENPYRLSDDIHGIGFKIADTLAKELGIPHDSLIRAQAGLRYMLSEFSKQGHCAAPQDKLISSTAALLEIPNTIIQTALETELAEHTIVADTLVLGEKVIFIKELYQAESTVAQNLLRLKNNKKIPAWSNSSWSENNSSLKLSSSQQQAVNQALHSKISIITGGPGVGKTTVISSLLDIVRQQGASIMLCAPTGRAAKRLFETTGLPAKTIHRCLEFDPVHKGFKRNANNPLQTDFLVIDEISMIDIILMNQLLKSVPDHASLVMVGDIDQLPSIGPGAVLADMIASTVIPVTYLTEIFRQAHTSDIIINAHRINQGKMPLSSPSSANNKPDFYFIETQGPEITFDKLIYLVTERIPKSFGFHPIRDIQVLTPMNKSSLGADALNMGLQKKLNGNSEPRIKRFEKTFAPGDKVIQRVNNYDKDVFNGDIGSISRIDLQEKSLIIDYTDKLVEYSFDDLDEINLAYATTIHKSQGSEYRAVVIPLALQHFNLLERNLLYTGITRGKKLVVLVGETKALAIAIKKSKSNTRCTQLAERLRAP